MSTFIEEEAVEEREMDICSGEESNLNSIVEDSADEDTLYPSITKKRCSEVLDSDSEDEVYARCIQKKKSKLPQQPKQFQRGERHVTDMTIRLTKTTMIVY